MGGSGFRTFCAQAATLDERLDGQFVRPSRLDRRASELRLAEWAGVLGLDRRGLAETAREAGVEESRLIGAAAEPEWVGSQPRWCRIVFAAARWVGERRGTWVTAAQRSQALADSFLRAVLPSPDRSFTHLVQGHLDRMIRKRLLEVLLPALFREAQATQQLDLLVKGGADCRGADLRRFLLQRPALARLCAEMSLNWSKFVREFRRRLERDGAKLGVGGPRSLVAVEGPCSDFHRDSRCVLRCSFSNGATYYYKPRPVSIERSWGSAMASLFQQSAPELVLERGYGWSKEVSKGGMGSPGAVRSAVRSLGRILAFFQVCQGTDLHADNICLGPEGAFVLDLETLFHRHGPGARFHTVGEVGGFEWNESLLRTDAFAVELLEDGQARGRRAGILLAGSRLPLWRRAQHPISGEWEWVPTPPVLEAEWAEIERQIGENWRVEIKAGFGEACEVLLMDPGRALHWISVLSRCPRRVVPRDTVLYHSALRDAVCGDAVGCGWERAMIFQRLARSKADGPRWLPAEERRALDRGDVPLLPAGIIQPQDLRPPGQTEILRMLAEFDSLVGDDRPRQIFRAQA